MAETLHRHLSVPSLYRLAGRIGQVCGWAAALLAVVAIYYGLLASPPDYQQGESVRIMYVHVPAAWLSLAIYMVVASASLVSLVWRLELADVVAAESAPLGAWFTALALATGALWGQPMWGTWWVWDARLTSELILLFLYFGYIGLRGAIEEPEVAARAGALLALVGVINVPIIHYSVEWWSTLHQGPTVTRMDRSAIDLSMLRPLLLAAGAFTLYYLAVLMRRVRCALIERAGDAPWPGALGEGEAP